MSDDSSTKTITSNSNYTTKKTTTTTEEDTVGADSTTEESLNESLNTEITKYVNEIETSTPTFSGINITTDSIKSLFGENWNGNFVDCTIHVEQYVSEVYTKLKYYSQLSSYLNKDNILDSLGKATALSNLQSEMNKLQQSYTGVLGRISNIKDFGVSVKGLDLTSATTVLNNVEGLLSGIEPLANNISSIMEQVKNAPELINTVTDSITNLTENISSKINDVQKMISESNISGLLDNFPDSVKDKFNNLTLIPKDFKMPVRCFENLKKTYKMLLEMKNPINKEQLFKDVKILLEAVKEAKNAVEEAKQGLQAINNVYNSIKNGNYAGVLDNISQHCDFVPKPSTFAAVYPKNYAVETSAGHILQVDDTPDAPALRVKDSGGSEVEMTHKGDVTVNTKNDLQFVTEQNFESHVKGKQSLIVDNDAYTKANSVKMITNENLDLSAKTTNFTAEEKMFIQGKVLEAMLSDKFTANVSNGIELHSTGPITLSSKSQITLDAPNIYLKATTLINLNSDAAINEIGKVYYNSSEVAAFKNTANSIEADAINIKGGLVNIIGKPLNLNPM